MNSLIRIRTPRLLISETTITVNLTASEAITTQNNDGFIPTEELEVAQVAQATEPKKCGRPVGSKDKQPRKKRAKNAAVEEESEWNTPYGVRARRQGGRAITRWFQRIELILKCF